MTSADASMPVSNWGQRLAAARGSRPVAMAIPADSRWGSLHQEFRDVTARIRQLHRNGGLLIDDAPAYQLLTQNLLGMSQLLAAEFTAAQPVPTCLLEQLLADVVLTLTEVERQWMLCELALDIYERLEPLSAAIVSGKETSIRPLFSLAEELLTTLPHCPVMPALIPCDANLLTSVLQNSAQQRFVDPGHAVLTPSVLTARIVASTSTVLLGGDRCDRTQLLHLTAAALVQDIGLLHTPLETLRQTQPWRVSAAARRRANPNHPGVSAAILARLDGCPTELVLLVGSHHERLDGSGYPQRSTAARQSQASRWLALAVRFAELLLEPQSQESANAHAEPLARAAGLRLWTEVRRGTLSEALASGLLNLVQPSLADDVAALHRHRQLRTLDQAHKVPAPHNRAASVSQSVDPATGSRLRADPPVAEPLPDAPAHLRRQRHTATNDMPFDEHVEGRADGAVSGRPADIHTPLVGNRRSSQETPR